VLITLTGLFMLLAWVLNFSGVSALAEKFSLMDAESAASFLLCGLALGCLSPQTARGLVLGGGRLFASLAVLFATLEIFEHVLSFKSAPGFNNLFPTLVSEQTHLCVTPVSLNFLAFGLSLLFLPHHLILSQMLAIIGGTITLQNLIGFAFSATPLGRNGTLVSMPLQTTLVFLLLAAGILAARAEHGLLSMLKNLKTKGLVIQRVMIPLAILLTTLGWVGLEGLHAGWYGPGFCLALRVGLSLLAVALVFWNSGVQLQRLEKGRDRALAALRQSEDRFRVAQELSMDGFMILKNVRDTSGAVVDFEFQYVNPAAIKITHKTPAELIGKRMLEVCPSIERHSDFVQKLIAVTRDNQARDFEVFHQSLEVSGWFRGMVVESGIDGLALSLTDITERKLAEQKLLKAEQEAREANHIKDEFLATVSHELRTPLQAILGWVRMMQSGKLSAANFTRGMQVIERNAKAQSQLIEDLLDVSRIVSGKLQLRFKAVDPIPVIESAMDSMRPAAEAKNIRLSAALRKTAAPLWADPDRLQQIVWNLLTNAVKFTPQGGSVEARLEQDGLAAKITISDTGRGMSREFLPHVFQRFKQADCCSSRAHGGLGIGLAVVRHLVELHGGTARAESDGENKGSKFTLTLPLMAQPEAPPSESSLRQAVCGHTPLECSKLLSGLHILIVEDEPDERELIAMVLEQCGAHVETASSVAEALARIKNHRPDAIVSDIGMAGEDGYELIRQVRELEQLGARHMPAAALTAFAKQEDRLHALAAGFETHVSKPVEPQDLACIVARLVGRSGNCP
jgi:PAS domain S-box-containing protein